MFDAYLGPGYEVEKREAVLDLQAKLHRFQGAAAEQLEDGRLAPEEYVDRFNHVLHLIFAECARVLGSSDFETLFGAPAEEMQGYIDKPTFLASRAGASKQVTAEHQFISNHVTGMRPTILVVDDSESSRSALRSTFEWHGYDVMLANDGLEALTCLESNLPDAMVVDVSMPRLNGFELLTLVHYRYERWMKDAAVVMVSGDVDHAREIEAAALGTVLFEKTPNSPDVVAAIRRGLAA